MGQREVEALDDRELELLEASLEKRVSYLAFCEDEELFPNEPPARPHRLICTLAQMVLDGEIRRLMIFAPPGTAKSTYISKRLVAFAQGYRPGIKLIGASHTATLASKHGRESRNIIAHPAYRAIFPEVELAPDIKARDDWETTDGGAYYAVGFDGSAVGRRADGIIIDDPFKGRREADSETIRSNIWTTYRSDLRSRLRKDGWIILMHQRWHEDDVAGRILPPSWRGESGWVTSRDGEDWFVANLQMEAEAPGDLLERKPGELLWPEWFDAARVAQDKISFGAREWAAQFQGVPTDEEGGILPRRLWRKWPGKTPPVVEYVLQSYDTAFEEGEEDDYSARTTWGVFDLHHPANADVLAEALASGAYAPWEWRDGAKVRKGEVHRYHAILLERLNARLEFNELRREARDAYLRHKPDRVLIEKKASGHSLIQELRRAGVPVKAVNPDRSKRSRAYAAQPVFEQGAVWYVERAWAEEVIRQCAAFPAGRHDDLVDTVTQSLIYLRRMFHLVGKGEVGADEYDDQLEDMDAANVDVIVRRA